MMNYHNKLKKLRRLMNETRDFGKIFDYFHEQLVHAPGFFRNSHPAENDFARQMAFMVAAQLGAGDAPEDQPFPFLRLAGSDFYHGTTVVGDRTLMVLYFKNDNKGLVISHGPRGEQGMLSRFSLVSSAPGTIPAQGSRAVN